MTLGDRTVTGTRWSLPTLASGGSITVTLTGTVTATSGTVTASAVAVSTTADPVRGDNITPTLAHPRQAVTSTGR